MLQRNASCHLGSISSDHIDSSPRSTSTRDENYLWIHRFSSPTTRFGMQLSHTVNQALNQMETTNQSLSSLLEATGSYQVSIRYSSQGKSRASSLFRHLRHEFLLVRGHDQGEYEGLEYVVDLAFRDQFEIPHPTLCYQELLKVVPQVFVGTMSSLVSLVQFLGRHIAQSFEAKGLDLPPWRHSDSILSKWSSASAQDADSQGGQSVLRPFATRSTSVGSSSVLSSNDNDVITSQQGEPLVSSFKFVIPDAASPLHPSSSQPLPDDNEGTTHPRHKLRRGLLSHLNQRTASQPHLAAAGRSYHCSVHEPIIPGLPRIFTVRPRNRAPLVTSSYVEIIPSNPVVADQRSSSTNI